MDIANGCTGGTPITIMKNIKGESDEIYIEATEDGVEYIKMEFDDVIKDIHLGIKKWKHIRLSKDN